jgi:uncharacterized protein DUF2505
MEFELEQRLHATPRAVLDMLLDRAFLDARADLPRLGSAEVLELSRDETSARVRVRMRFSGDLSSAVTAVVDPAKLTWVDDAGFVLEARGARHEIVPDHYPDRLSSRYDDVLHHDGDATRRVLTGTLKVRVPLVGGRVERAIVSGLREYVEAEGDLLNRWLER